MKLLKINTVVFLAFIFVIGLMVRTYKLGELPYGFHNDEARVGWNAYSIMKTGSDDKGNWMPAYYDSFGDFRPAGLIYLAIPSIFVWGNNVFAVRFPFALVGALTCIPIFLFVEEVLGKKQKIGLYSSLILMLNPWHIVASRSTSESVVAMFLTLCGLYFFVKLINRFKYVDCFWAYAMIVSSFFFYHNIRVLAPIFLVIIVLFYKVIVGKTINLGVFFVLLAVALTSVVVFLSPESRSRMSQVSLKSDFQVLYEVTKMPSEEGPGKVFVARAFHNRIVSYTRRFVEEYKDYFSTNFLVGNIGKPIRYSVPQVGLLTYVELGLVVVGMMFVSSDIRIFLIFILLAVSPLPSAVTIEDVPNIQRSIFMVLFLSIMAGYGMDKIFNLKSKWMALKIVLFMALIINFVYFGHMYLSHQKMGIASYYRNGGNVELVNVINALSKNYNRVWITNSPDNLYPWMAYLSYYDPKLFNQTYNQINDGVRMYKNLVFTTDKCPINRGAEENRIDIEESLFINAEGCVLENRFANTFKLNVVETISRPDNSLPFKLVSLKRI